MRLHDTESSSKIECRCDYCGKTFMVWRAWARRDPTIGSFCSMKCLGLSKVIANPLDYLLAHRRIDASTQCWIWIGSTRCGYGRIGINKSAKVVHRLSYELLVGPIPDGLCVLHRCDVRRCFNPDHLFLGTKADNNRDMIAKGRNRNLRGSAHPMAKLTEDDVRDIRRLAKEGMTNTELANRFGIAEVTACHIVARRSWRHLQDSTELERTERRTRRVAEEQG